MSLSAASPPKHQYHYISARLKINLYVDVPAFYSREQGKAAEQCMCSKPRVHIWDSTTDSFPSPWGLRTSVRNVLTLIEALPFSQVMEGTPTSGWMDNVRTPVVPRGLGWGGRLGGLDILVLRQFLAEALGMLQVAELVPTVPEIIKVGLSELSPQICWIFFYFFSLSTWHSAPWKPLTKLGFAPPLHSTLLRCKVSGNITYRFYSQCFQTMEIKFFVQEATESTVTK